MVVSKASIAIVGKYTTSDNDIQSQKHTVMHAIER